VSLFLFPLRFFLSHLFTYLFIYLFLFSVLGIDPRAAQMIGKCSSTCILFSQHLCFVFCFWIRVLLTLPKPTLNSWSSCLLPE
jgi:hypothetical protein